MKVIYFLFFLTLFVGNTTASEYFDFEVSTRKVVDDKEIGLSFEYDLEGYDEEDFIVRPRISRGNIKVLEPENNEWISQSDLWTALPNLQKDMKLQVMLDGSAELYFDIQNTIDQKVYHTKKVQIWGGDVYSGYAEKLNNNIEYFDQEEKGHNEPKKPQKQLSFIAKVIKYIDEII